MREKGTGMVAEQARAIKIFYCYARKDKALLDPNDFMLPYLKERVLLFGIGCIEEQLLIYKQELADIEKRILSDPDDATDYYDKSEGLNNLRRHDEALIAIEQAIHLDPNKEIFHRFRGHILMTEERFEEVLLAYEQVIHLDPNCTHGHNGKALVLHFLDCEKEVLTAIEHAISLDPDNLRLKCIQHAGRDTWQL